MFERFTDSARRVMVLAQEEVRLRGAADIGDEYLLVGMAGLPESTAGRLLAEVGVGVDRLRERFATPSAGRRKHSGHLPFTAPAKKVLEGGLRESVRSGSREVGTEHLLMALTRVDGAGVAMLRALEVDVDDLRNRAVEAASTAKDAVEETQATPWSTPRADVGAQLAGIESTLAQILERLTAIERRLGEK